MLDQYRENHVIGLSILMINKLFFICLFLLASCSMPGTAFLGPVFTGAKTGSVYQASLSYTTSYTTSQVFEEIKKKDVFRISNNLISDKSLIDQIPVIQSTYKVVKVEFSQVLEPEPLP